MIHETDFITILNNKVIRNQIISISIGKPLLCNLIEKLTQSIPWLFLLASIVSTIILWDKYKYDTIAFVIVSGCILVMILNVLEYMFNVNSRFLIINLQNGQRITTEMFSKNISHHVLKYYNQKIAKNKINGSYYFAGEVGQLSDVIHVDHSISDIGIIAAIFIFPAASLCIIPFYLKIFNLMSYWFFKYKFLSIGSFFHETGSFVISFILGGIGFGLYYLFESILPSKRVFVISTNGSKIEKIKDILRSTTEKAKEEENKILNYIKNAEKEQEKGVEK
jgi:hypothetical protein